MSRPKNFTRLINIRISEPQLAALRDVSVEDGVALTALIRQAIARLLREREVRDE